MGMSSRESSAGDDGCQEERPLSTGAKILFSAGDVLERYKNKWWGADQKFCFPYIFFEGHSLWETETIVKNRKMKFLWRSFCKHRAMGPKTRKFRPTEIAKFCGRLFSCAVHRNKAKFCRWLDKFTSPQK